MYMYILCFMTHDLYGVHTHVDTKSLKLHFWLSFEKCYFDDKTLYLNCTS